ncbi:MAG: hypothetical protein K6E91_00585 [Butyrivibrio sp.]|nr:hypothetical protein [Butyrivibrio sp.]
MNDIRKERLILSTSTVAFLVFYHGIHETSLLDVSVATMLFMSCFAVFDRIELINLIIVEYWIIMIIQFVFLMRSTETDLSPFNIVKIVFHIGTVMMLYIFTRMTISTRIVEREA